MTYATSSAGTPIHFPLLTGEDPTGPIPAADPAEIETIAKAVAPGELLLFARRLIDGSRKKARSPRWAVINAQRLGLAKLCIDRALGELEPHYDWGAYGWERLDGAGEGFGRHVQLEWFGLKLSIVVGRRPRKVVGGK